MQSFTLLAMLLSAHVWSNDATTQNDGLVRQTGTVDSEEVPPPPELQSFGSEEEKLQVIKQFNAAAEKSHVAPGLVEPHPPTLDRMAEVSQHKHRSKGTLIEDAAVDAMEQTREGQPYGWRAAKDGK